MMMKSGCHATDSKLQPCVKINTDGGKAVSARE